MGKVKSRTIQRKVKSNSRIFQQKKILVFKDKNTFKQLQQTLISSELNQFTDSINQNSIMCDSLNKVVTALKKLENKS